jgi:DNA-binding response OmpR family regulator
MPGFDGLALAAAIRRFRSDIKILFVSGGADGPARASAIPMANYLAKPFKPEALLTRVQELLSSS